ncbi:Deoxynucleoside triphosphate triphosphohydrolase SAMHD1 [Phytophthora citrophthora]|uniref:Deoxynucleoside triphosphate triphosphohydrolase SAMHD1 n=1 Tax=Phytophthora citrophthora TaxID=4793 RepID=A0AAD9GIG6_9STRA|nr:Deoxynucleoside triphosphate triphosphohydrolase SAMHD1 [Phytophthora citrophthora]
MQDSSEDIEAVVAASTSHDDTASTKRRKNYSVKLKRHQSLRAASRKFGVPRRTSSDWVKEKENILSFKGLEKTLARTTGIPELIPFSTELVTYMKDIRHTDQPLTTTKMAHYIKTEHLHWIAAYTATKAREDAAYESLLRLMRRTPHGLKFLTDHIVHSIEASKTDTLAEARALLKRMRRRELYEFIDEYLLPPGLMSRIPRFTAEELTTQTSLDGVTLDPEDIIVSDGRLNYNFKDRNPVDNVSFYASSDLNNKFHIPKEEVSLLFPEKFEERIIRVYSRNKSTEVHKAIQLLSPSFKEENGRYYLSPSLSDPNVYYFVAVESRRSFLDFILTFICKT